MRSLQKQPSQNKIISRACPVMTKKENVSQKDSETLRDGSWGEVIEDDGLVKRMHKPRNAWFASRRASWITPLPKTFKPRQKFEFGFKWPPEPWYTISSGSGVLWVFGPAALVPNFIGISSNITQERVLWRFLHRLMMVWWSLPQAHVLNTGSWVVATFLEVLDILGDDLLDEGVYQGCVLTICFCPGIFSLRVLCHVMNSVCHSSCHLDALAS